MCQRIAKSFRSRHAQGKAHVQTSHGHSRLDIEAGTLDSDVGDVDTRWIDSDWATDLLVSRSLEAAQSSLTAEHRDRRQCRQEQKLREMHSEAAHAKDSSSVLWGIELGAELIVGSLHSDSTASISQHTKKGLGRMKHVELRFLFVKDLPEARETHAEQNSWDRESC